MALSCETDIIYRVIIFTQCSTSVYEVHHDCENCNEPNKLPFSGKIRFFALYPRYLGKKATPYTTQGNAAEFKLVILIENYNRNRTMSLHIRITSSGKGSGDGTGLLNKQKPPNASNDNNKNKNE